MQAITTHYHGPTNTRGSRITARACAGSVTVPYDHALNIEDNHAAAARALVVKLGWQSRDGNRYGAEWLGGGLPNGHGYCFVMGNSDIAFRVSAP